MRKAIARASAGTAILIAVAVLLLNQTLFSYSLIGFNLGTTQRDFRIYNNFLDATANDNTTPDPDFGGLTGATLALSKGVIEWGSELMGASSWGNGGANFDAIYVGPATGTGDTNDNIMSGRNANGGGVIAYTYPSSNGWQIRYYDQPWVWYDGPGNTPTSGNNMDLQGICCHEYGHALGLDHTSATNATMYAYASSSGNSLRTIETDDKNGVKAIYGTASSSKPRIDSMSGGSDYGDTLTLVGANFSSTGNEVWFTRDGSQGSAYVVSNLASYSSGTRIDVTIPTQARDGMVMVKKNASGHSSLSNVYPLDIGGGGGGDDPVPDAKVNGQNGPMSIPQSAGISFTVSLDPGSHAGENFDWWIWAQYEPPWFPQYWWTYPGSWVSNYNPVRAYGGKLFAVNNYVIASASSLNKGYWEFGFALDAWDNSYQGTFIDVVEVTIY